MKIFKKYALLLIVATCALHSGAFGMQTGAEFARELYKTLWEEKFDKSKLILQEAQRTLKDYTQFWQFFTTPSQDDKGFLEENFPTPLFMALYKSNYWALDFTPSSEILVARCNCLAVAIEIIKTALACLKGKDFYQFANACDSSGQSFLYLIISGLCYNPEDKCLPEVAQFLIKAVGSVIKQKGLGSKEFSKFLLAKKDTETVLWRALDLSRSSNSNYYYCKVAKLFASAVKAGYLSSDEESEVFYEIFSFKYKGNPPLMLLVERSNFVHDNGPVINFINLAASCFSEGEYKEFIGARGWKGLTAFDLAEGNDELRRLLDPAKAIENYKFKHELFKKKAEIKANKKEIQQLMGKIPGLQQECLEKKYMLNQCVGVVSETLE